MRCIVNSKFDGPSCRYAVNLSAVQVGFGYILLFSVALEDKSMLVRNTKLALKMKISYPI